MQLKGNKDTRLLLWYEGDWHSCSTFYSAPERGQVHGERMPNARWERIGGPIRGLRLPFDAWEALRREGITTLDRLRAMADQIHTLPGIGSKTAQLIREELERVTRSPKTPD
jgi:DNA-directed RNA polymerase alpha subunit